MFIESILSQIETALGDKHPAEDPLILERMDYICAAIKRLKYEPVESGREQFRKPENDPFADDYAGDRDDAEAEYLANLPNREELAVEENDWMDPAYYDEQDFEDNEKLYQGA